MSKFKSWPDFLKSPQCKVVEVAVVSTDTLTLYIGTKLSWLLLSVGGKNYDTMALPGLP